MSNQVVRLVGVFAVGSFFVGCAFTPPPNAPGTILEIPVDYDVAEDYIEQMVRDQAKMDQVVD